MRPLIANGDQSFKRIIYVFLIYKIDLSRQTKRAADEAARLS
jgi:hypothetical protein